MSDFQNHQVAESGHVIHVFRKKGFGRASFFASGKSAACSGNPLVFLKPKGLAFLLLAFLLCFPLYAKINFSEPDLSEDDRLLLRASSRGGGAAAQSTLFLSRPRANLPGASGAGVLPQSADMKPLSAFPERLDLIENGRTLQVRNAFGAVRLPVSGGLPRQIPGFFSFAGGNPAPAGGAENALASSDGKLVLYLESQSPSRARLILLDSASGKKTEVASQIEKPDKLFPASWSPDSRFFIYAKGENLYYYSVNSVPAGEKFRFIGEGAVNSVCWDRGGEFFYLRGSTLFHARGADLFARALYADFLEAGRLAGKIPFEFDPAFDFFRVAPDSRSMIVSRGGGNIFYFPLDSGSGNPGGNGGASFPYLAVSKSCVNIEILWPRNGNLTVLAYAPSDGAGKVFAWRLGVSGEGAAFSPLSFPGGEASFSGASLSPDGSKVLLWGREGAGVYDYAEWKPLRNISVRPSYAGLWTANDEIITGDSFYIEKTALSFDPGAAVRRDIICLSEPEFFAFENETSFSQRGERVPGILARNGERWFVTDGESPWTEILNPEARPPSRSSALYRVYLENQNNNFYENIPMLRNIFSSGTFPLLRALPGEGGGEVGLCFDLYDGAEGLSETLDALKKFDFKATFFLGGEFIRRHPEAAFNIAEAGHETASMFFAPIDLSDPRYRITEDFISRGLARNEDEFYRATGRELALVWHPPFYSFAPGIREAAAAAGYVTIDRDFEPGETTGEKAGIAGIIDGLVPGVKGGEIIPVRLGLIPGKNGAYLFNRLNVLLGALAREGFTVVPVSRLKKHP